MRHIKFKKDTKETCLKILADLRNDRDFQYLVENMLAETYEVNRDRCAEMIHTMPEFPVVQGVTQAFREITEICHEAREVLERIHNKTNTRPVGRERR